MKLSIATLNCLIVVLMTSGLLSCTSNERGSMSTSLLGVTSESRTYRGELVDQTEFVSIAGLLPTPAPGLIYHMIEKSEQQSLLGISYDTKSFVLIGESAPDGRDFTSEVSQLKKLIEEHDLVQTRILETTAQIAALEQKAIAIMQLIQKTDAEAVKNKTPADSNKAAKDNLQLLINGINTDISKEKAATSLYELHRDDLTTKIRDISALPGIIVAKWRSNEFGSLSIDAVPFGSASAARRSEMEGYVILGGVRIIVPFFSMDASTMFLDIEEASPGSLKSLQYSAVTTYLLQAKEIAYTNASSAATYLKLKGTLNAAQMSSWASAIAAFQQVTLEAAHSSTQQNVSGGRIGKFDWKRIDVNFSDRWNEVPHDWSAHHAKDLRDIAQDKLLAIAGADASNIASPNGEWSTVVVQVMTPTRLTRMLTSAYSWWTGALSTPGNVDKLEKIQNGGRPPSLVRELLPKNPKPKSTAEDIK